MTTTTKEFVPPKTASPAPSQDLSLRLERELPKEKYQRVKAHKISSSMYRVNWMRMSKDAIPSLTIDESRFLEVHEVSGKLQIADRTIRRETNAGSSANQRSN